MGLAVAQICFQLLLLCRTIEARNIKTTPRQVGMSGMCSVSAEWHSFILWQLFAAKVGYHCSSLRVSCCALGSILNGAALRPRNAQHDSTAGLMCHQQACLDWQPVLASQRLHAKLSSHPPCCHLRDTLWKFLTTRHSSLFAAGASQVKWNKKNANCLATSHDGDVRIWDKRVSQCRLFQWKQRWSHQLMSICMLTALRVPRWCRALWRWALWEPAASISHWNLIGRDSPDMGLKHWMLLCFLLHNISKGQAI